MRYVLVRVAENRHPEAVARPRRGRLGRSQRRELDVVAAETADGQERETRDRRPDEHRESAAGTGADFVWENRRPNEIVKRPTRNDSYCNVINVIKYSCVTYTMVAIAIVGRVRSYCYRHAIGEPVFVPSLSLGSVPERSPLIAVGRVPYYNYYYYNYYYCYCVVCIKINVGIRFLPSVMANYYYIPSKRAESNTTR